MRTSFTTLDALLTEVVAQNERKHDVLADTRSMHVVDTDTLAIDAPHGRESFKLNDYALGQMSNDLGIPKRDFDHMRENAPDLFRSNIHQFLFNEPNRRMIRGLKPLKPEDALTGRAWLSDRYRRLDNIEIALDLVPEFENLSTPVEFHNASISSSRFYLRAVFPRIEAAVKVSDVVQWGVQIRNSEVGAGPFVIENFVLRPACANGMVVGKVMTARHVGRRVEDEGILSDETFGADNKAFWPAARDMLRASLSETVFESVVASLRKTTEGAEIEDEVKAADRLASTLSLTEGEQEMALMNLTLGGDMSRWGALNAITATAKVVDTFDRQVELEEMGWTLALLSEREWERIAV